MRKNRWTSTMKLAKVIVLAMLVGALAIGFSVMAIGQETIRFILIADPFAEGIKRFTPEFEKETGIKVIVEPYGWTTMWSKQTLDMASDTQIYDVEAVNGLVVGTFGEAGYLEDLGPYMKRDAAEINVADIIGLEQGEWKGKQESMPFLTYAWLLHYRADLFEKYGLEVPRTFREYYNAASKLTLDRNGDGKIDMYGCAVEGKMDGAVWSVWETIIKPWGAKYFRDAKNADYYPTFTSEECKEATEYMLSLTEFSPPDAINYHQFDSLEDLMQDRLAMHNEWDLSYGVYNDPEKSTVVGKVKPATSMVKEGVVPGPGVGPLRVMAWNVGMNKDSQNKEAAWKYIKWLLSEETQLKMALNGYATPARKSQLANPELQKKAPILKVVSDAIAKGYWTYAFMPPGSREFLQEIVGLRLNEILVGKYTIDQALELMNQDTIEFMKEQGVL